MDVARNQTRAITAGVVGNVMEWFDFAVYGYFAPVIGMQFFPAENPVTSLLAAFGVFASGFLARPVGAAFFGHLGDRHGRHAVLRYSVLLMGAATFAMGLLPTYAMVGIAAPIALTLLRLAQGFSVGGEYTGSVIFLVESAPMGRRGLVSAWANAGAVAGFVLGSGIGAGISALCTPEMLAAWGWRIPFLLGVGIAAVARFYRRELGVEVDRSTDVGAGSFATVEALRTEWPTMLRIIGVILMANVGFYMMFVYVTTYLSEQVGVSTARALEIDTIAMATLLVFVPVAGWMSDRVGRKPILLTASIGVLIFSVPLLMLIRHDDTLLILAGQIGFALLIGFSFGGNGAAIVEMTRSRLRCSTISVAYNVALAIFGGTTPLVAAWLISQTHDDLTPAYYLMGLAAVTTAVLLTLPETAHDQLD